MEHPLKQKRAKKKLSQGKLAALSGVAKATISRLETGVITNPQTNTVNALEDALGLKRGTLVFGDEAIAS
jgi:transcriptional regulator with XRE-family HTH domain